MSKCYTYNGKVLFQDELISAIGNELDNNPELSGLKDLLLSVQSDIIGQVDGIIRASKGKVGKPNYIGVSSLLEQELYTGEKDALGRPVKRVLSPVYDEQARIDNSLEQFLPIANGNQEEAIKLIKERISEEKAIAEVGDLVHELISIALKNHTTTIYGYESSEFSEAIKQAKEKIETSQDHQRDGETIKSLKYVLTFKETTTNSIDEIIERIVKVVQDTEKLIYDNPQYKDAKIYSEVDIATENIKNIDRAEGVGGRVDLLIVKKDGSIDIVDFKVSSRRYSDWYAAKAYHTDYQLGAYRAILASNGINSSKIKLQTLPIEFPLGKFSQMHVENLQNRTISSGGKVAHLDNDLGLFTKKINFLFTFPSPTFANEPIQLDNNIQETLQKLITPFKQDTQNYSRESLMNRVFPKTINGELRYVLIDINTGEQIIKKNKEDFLRHGTIDKMLKKQSEKLTDTMKQIISMVDNYIAKGEIKDSYDFRNSTNDDNGNVYNVLNSTFGKYCNGRYLRIDGEIGDVLAQYRIVAFKNIYDNTIDVIILTDQDIHKIVDNNNSSTVLGKFVSNSDARKLSLFSENPDRVENIPVMESTAGNMELIQAMAVLNNIPEMFQNAKLGIIKVINPQIGQSDIPDIDQLKTNFKFLTTKAEIENNFTNKIQTAEMWEFMISELNTLVYNAQPDDELKIFVSGISDMNVQTKDQKIAEIIRLRKKLRSSYIDYLQKSDFTESRTFQHPSQIAYYILSQTLNYYEEMPIAYNGKLTKWGLKFGEITRMLGTPFFESIKESGNELSDGTKGTGFLQGLDMSTPSATPSQNLQKLFKWYNTAYMKLRKDFFKQANTVNNLCKPYIREKNSQLSSLIINDTSDIWESLLVHDSDGKLSKDLSIRNPYTDNTLTESEKHFLKNILWELNKYRIKGLDREMLSWDYDSHESAILENQVVNFHMDKDYFQLPLRRSVDFYKLKHLNEVDLKTWFSEKWNALKEDYDLRKANMVSSFEVDAKIDRNTTQMYHSYQNISQEARQRMIDEEGVRSFEIDLNLLALDMAYQTLRKTYFEEVLELTDSIATVLHYIQNTSDTDFTPEIQALDDQSNISIKNKSVIPEELNDATRALGIAKKFNAAIVLAARPLQFFKELTFGQFTNYSRAWGMKNTSMAVSAKNIFEANKIIWGQSLRKYGKVFKGEGDIADFTLVEAINKVYGLANEDINSIVEKAALSRHGIYGGLSKWMYISNSAPDYFNRMALFIAKMMEDGCFEAHELDADGNLVYDFKKDKRFSELVQHGINSDYTGKEYLKQKGMYRIMLESLIKEGITNEDGTTLKFGDELPRAYTNKQQQSIKEVADIAYGFYDHETKSLIDHKVVGLVFKQFMAFWTAKTTLWFRGKGSQTSQGRFVEAKDNNGETLYRRIIEENGGKIGVQLVPESKLTAEEVGKLEPQYMWQGDYVEGLIYSIGGTLYDIIHADWKHLAEDKYQLGNLKLALHDILIGVILFSILKWIFSGGSGKMADVSPAERTLLRAMQDVGPSGLTSLSFEPSFYTTLTNLQQDLPKVLSGDKGFTKFVSQRFSAVKDFTTNAIED